MNNLSSIAQEIMEAGLIQRNPVVPFYGDEIVKQCYSVPEKPADYKYKIERPESEVVVLVTGGLDSTVLYFMAKKKYKKVRAFYIDIGQPYAQKELDALRKLKIKPEIISAKKFSSKDYWKHIIPGRNFYFLCLVAERIKGGRILFGATEGEMPESGGDKSLQFLLNVNLLFCNILPYEVKVLTPLMNMTKTDLVKWWRENLPLKKLDYTISCFEEENGHCGRCQACLRKALAYINNKLKLKTNIPVVEGCKKFIEKYLILMPRALKEEDFSRYSKRRCLQDIKAITELCSNI